MRILQTTKNVFHGIIENKNLEKYQQKLSYITEKCRKIQKNYKIIICRNVLG